MPTNDVTVEATYKIDDQVEFTLGNASSTNASADGWKSNLVINETDIYTNNSGSTEQITIDQFSFYARQEGDPVTPFVVRVNSDNNFTVLAIGTTRASTAYNVGQNNVAFKDGGATITVNNGDKIATGFLDANADGSGGSVGSVIPFDGTSPDQIWYTGGAASTNSGSVSEGPSRKPRNYSRCRGWAKTDVGINRSPSPSAKRYRVRHRLQQLARRDSP